MAGDSFNSLRLSISLVIEKLEKYIGLIEQSPAYWAATILHPRFKTR